MPAITSGKVLVTGATGYLGEWVVQKLLEQGYSVRATVRSEAKGSSLKDLLAKFGDQLELTIVHDMIENGAFDAAVTDVDAILHLASPLILNADDPDDLIRPAVAGTLGVLRSALNFGDAVKRVVVTSSGTTVHTIPSGFRIYTEADWNEQAVKEVETKGRQANNMNKYRASKIHAERAVWEFAKKHKADMKFDVTVLIPPVVFGPTLNFSARTLDEVTGSMRIWVDGVVRAKSPELLVATGGGWVDVRDIAQAHILAIQNEAVAGHRIIISAGVYKWQEWVNIAHGIDGNLPVGDTSFDSANPNYDYLYDTSKAAKFFGIQYRSKEQTTRDILDQFQRQGLLP